MLNDRFEEREGVYRRQRTPLAKAQAERDWVVVDATNQTLGRLASRCAAILRGKHKPTFTPSVDCGDGVIVVNADKIVVTGKKANQKIYYSHSGYLGGLRARTYREMMERDPSEVVRIAINGMVPHTRLGRLMRTRLRVYVGPDHPHTAQAPDEVPAAN
ncbi:50S ribosomal protein L13 [Candidatus Poribacteria bacterium]|jgi:large subunit ribosomal protein L13|nr:50S ribosomal protein L13 [Candidatus Poribacteria bacterium]